MVVLIDTNIILDSLLEREPFVIEADEILYKCNAKNFAGYIAAHTIPNIFYILRKQFSVRQRKEMLSRLCGFVKIAGISSYQAINAIRDETFDDLEDYLQVECAQSIGAEYIVTRDVPDFVNSAIPAISPENFLKKLNG